MARWGTWRCIHSCGRMLRVCEVQTLGRLVLRRAWYGRGKRTGVYGSFLLAIYDPESEEYQAREHMQAGMFNDCICDER